MCVHRQARWASGHYRRLLITGGFILTDYSALIELGWSPHWQALYEPHVVADMTPARVVRSDRGSSLVATPDGVIRAKPSVHLKKASSVQAEMPVVGDWIAVLASEDLEVPFME